MLAIGQIVTVKDCGIAGVRDFTANQSAQVIVCHNRILVMMLSGKMQGVKFWALASELEHSEWISIFHNRH